MKQTEIGMIPDDWEVKELESLCSLITKQTGFDYSATIKPALVTEIQENTISFIQNKDFEEEKINYETDFYIPLRVAKKFPRIFLDSDVLLISISGRIGNVAHFKHRKDAFIGGAVGIARFLNNDNINYSMRYLLSDSGQKQIFSNQKSGAQHNLTIADVRKLKIPFPPTLAEQQKIAKALSDVDNIISTLEKLITKKKNLKQGTMQQLLTGKKRLPGFVQTTATKQTELGEIPADWEVKELGEVAKNFTGLTYSPENINEYGTLVLRSSNIQNDMLAFEDNVYVNMNIPERAIVHTGDILICVRNGSKRLIGKSALITESANNCAFGAFMTIMRTELLNQQFLFYVWQSDLIQKQIEESMGATINQITNKDIRHYLIAYPKSNTEQTAIANVLSSMDKEIEALNTKLEKYRNLKTGMMQQLLTGKIRLV